MNFLVETDLLKIDLHFEAGAEGIEEGALGSRFLVDGFDGDSGKWLESSIEEVVEESEGFGKAGVIGCDDD